MHTFHVVHCRQFYTHLYWFRFWKSTLIFSDWIGTLSEKAPTVYLLLLHLAHVLMWEYIPTRRQNMCFLTRCSTIFKSTAKYIKNFCVILCLSINTCYKIDLFLWKYNPLPLLGGKPVFKEALDKYNIIHQLFPKKLGFLYYLKCWHGQWLHAKLHVLDQFTFEEMWIFLAFSIFQSRLYKIHNTVVYGTLWRWAKNFGIGLI